MTLTVTGVHHTGMTVSDLQTSVDFYGRFGFEEEERLEESGPEVDEGTGVTGAYLRVAMLVRGDTRLELIEYANSDGARPPAHPNNGIGAAHLAIEVDDIDAAVAELRKDGVEFTSDPIYHESGLRWVYMKDPDGITTELFQVLR
jgi:catechol 2,3-dioxygenase-like lactoylglutathione lyase family enzyme